MTKSTITREESVQAVFDLKIGYRLEFADLEILKRVARMALAAMDSGESVELPLDYLQGHKDGLEWAAQLAEANHPETGDWLYDDPIELAKAIRKGPDMPPVQPVADSEPVAWTWQHLKQWYVTNDEERARELAWDGVKVEQLYRHAHPAPVVLDGYVMVPVEPNGDMLAAAQDAYGETDGDIASTLRAAMLAADPQLPGSDPATVPGKWIPVSERMPEDEQEVLTINKMGHRFVSFFDKHSGLFFDRLDAPAACCIEHVLVTHWMPLPAAPQEVK
ncbi:DUF551 domain-containing protein [Escherichia coli]|uniref:DUF551 domain-containing protein n=1 Tax=Escherichia coli TaxID=562 RepID=UPI00230194C8|nr:DUF551 domain-containing protein [Escherichia coli]MDA7157604.1 DUF551 domain-containing protein [Escherichia coli]MDA7181161.1 DUF551 domain-containing protein [Escherichia coli]